MKAFSCIMLACIVIAVGMLACMPVAALTKSEVLSNYQAPLSLQAFCGRKRDRYDTGDFRVCFAGIVDFTGIFH